MFKKYLTVLSVLITAFSFSACYDGVEIDDYSYVTMLGIERGVSDQFRYTLQIPEFSVSEKKGGGETGGETEGEEQKVEKENITIEAPSLLSAVAIVNSSIPKIINFMHLKAIVISEDMALSGMIGEIVAPLVRYRQIRTSTNVIICKGSAKDFVRAMQPYMGGLVTQTLEELMARSEYTGYFPQITLNEMYKGLKSRYYQILGIYGAVNKGENFESEGAEYTGEFKPPGDYYAGDTPIKGGPEVELMGAVASDGDKMIAKLTGFETQVLLLVRNELKRAPFTIPDPKAPEFAIPIEVKEFEGPKISVDLSGENPKIKVEISMEGDITAIESRINYEHPEMKHLLEEAFEKFLKEGIEKTYAKCRAVNVDAFEFGTYAVKHFSTIQEWENYNWLDKFSRSELEVEVNFTIRRTGKILRSMPIISTEGKE